MIELTKEDRIELSEMLRQMARTEEVESDCFFGGDMTEEARARNLIRQQRQAENSKKYSRWADAISAADAGRHQD